KCCHFFLRKRNLSVSTRLALIALWALLARVALSTLCTRRARVALVAFGTRRASCARFTLSASVTLRASGARRAGVALRASGAGVALSCLSLNSRLNTVHVSGCQRVALFPVCLSSKRHFDLLRNSNLY